MYFDAHTHLNAQELYPQRESLLKEFLDIWWKGLVNIWVNEYYNLKGIEIAQKSKNNPVFKDLIVKATIGIHPCEIGMKEKITEGNIEDEKQKLLDLYKANKDVIVGIGEIGIDTHYEWTIDTVAIQQKIFTRQCERARTLWLPVIIHSRANFPATLDVLKNFSDLTIYFHCRGYGPSEIQTLVTHFPKLFIGFCGNISYPKAQELRDSFLELTQNWKDLSRVVLETDAPYLTPQAVRKERNKPSLITYLYDYISEEFWIPMKTLQDTTADNFMKLYQL